MRSVDDIANDYMNAETEQEKQLLSAELQVINDALADAHLRNGHVAEYQRFIKYDRP